MSKFKVMIVEKDGIPIAVQAAEINGRVICIALKDEPELMGWHNAIKCGIPSKSEWQAISENFEKINQVLKEYGGEPLHGWYWSSSEYDESNYVCIVRPSDGCVYSYYSKNNITNVRSAFILNCLE